MRFRIVISFAILALALTLTAAPASAVSGSNVQGYSFGCSSVSVTYTTVTFNRNNVGSPAPGDEAYMFTITDGNGNVLSSFTTSRPVGSTIVAQTEDFPYDRGPAANPIHFVLVSLAGNGFPAQTIWDLQGVCNNLEHGSPGIPDGFVLKHIICDTPVYNTAAGSPVGDAHVNAGQTFYVNPTPVDGADGKSWTEIYVSSTTNPFIPSVCVN